MNQSICMDMDILSCVHEFLGMWGPTYTHIFFLISTFVSLLDHDGLLVKVVLFHKL